MARKFLRLFLPFFLLAAVLPVFMFLVFRPPDFSFLTQADQDIKLRLWIEPSTVVTKVNENVKIDIVAFYEAESKLIPWVSFSLFSDPSVSLEKSQIKYSNPFRGRVVVDTLFLTASKVGTFSVSIPSEQVTTQDDSLKVITSPATIIVK